MSTKGKKSLGKTFFNGIIPENPIFRLVLGMCPTLAVSTAAINGIGMGLATTAVLVLSNLFISLMRNIIPEKVRIPSFIVIIASFVTIIEMLIKAFFPALNESLGIYIPLIVVNCIIFARAESFAFNNPPMPSIMDGLGMGVGFTLGITILASIREILGAGTIFGYSVFGSAFEPFMIIGQPAGGFLTLGFLLLGVNALVKILEKRKKNENKKGVTV